jgi:electron-transferring-flavoprotein dehydrogenase
VKQGAKPAKRVSYGARAITAGGLLALPKTVFPGGALVGCEAGYLNVPAASRAAHAAIKTGIVRGRSGLSTPLASRSRSMTS